MLVLHFQGWFQCRLATNPDPTDEPRGISGYTFALPGEPDLDRVIRFHEPVAPRSHARTVGVYVNDVVLEGVSKRSHPLRRAPVALLCDPVFESRNRLLTDDKSGSGLIHPFHVRISGERVVVQREDMVYPTDPTRRLHEIPVDFLNRRAPMFLDGFMSDPMRVHAATGVADPAAVRRRRKSRLERDLELESDPLRRAALEKRIAELAIDDPLDVRSLMLQAVQRWRFNVNGPAVVDDPVRLLGIQTDTSRDWPIEFWMGAWDADALAGFVRGSLTIPPAGAP